MSQHYHAESEEGVNKQINLELYAMYTYVSMSAYFEREDAALPGFAKYFAKASDERMEHAKKWMKFQNVRRGHILLRDIRKPASNSWRRGKEAIQAALELEIAINQALLDLHKIADKHADFHMTTFVEGFLDEQEKRIKQLGDHITNLQRVDSGHGDYHFDQQTLM